MPDEAARRRLRALAEAGELPVSEEDLPDLAERWVEISSGIARLLPMIDEEDRPLTEYRPGRSDD